ncbi:hypothetical protein CTI12_AA310950 [Artemisia annua]|uniref:Uncharacterized protein n=1 Tax=Artemisia annua TaxID=35608 RepID=A0A2U1MVW2_ARTAN|nr:hypothetical protein CTI12_AA310950 [Artemisia annua]
MGGVDGGSDEVKNRGDGGVNSSDMDEAIKKCLEKKQGDYSKCKQRFQALNTSPKKSSNKPLFPLRLRAGSLTDV